MARLSDRVGEHQIGVKIRRANGQALLQLRTAVLAKAVDGAGREGDRTRAPVGLRLPVEEAFPREPLAGLAYGEDPASKVDVLPTKPRQLAKP